MSRLLVLGIGPLPIENPERAYGGCNRTWHFTKVLRDAGHELCLVCMRTTNLEHPDHELHIRRAEGVFCLDVDEMMHMEDPVFLAAVCRQFNPDGIVGVNPYCAYCACRMASDAPLWADLHGYRVGEVQLESELFQNDFTLRDRVAQMRVLLQRADVFSCTAGPHVYTTVGELGLAGRLNRRTPGYSFVHEIPLAQPAEPYTLTRPRIRPALAGPGDVVVLWSGSFNLWTDVTVLVEGLRAAMEQEPRLVFVSTGGVVSGSDNGVYDRVREGLLASPVSARCHFLGWIPADDVPGTMLEADLGLSIDRPCYEAIIGARNRLTTMMKASLPAITTLAPEISRIVGEAGCGWTIPLESPAAFRDALLRAAADPEERARRGARALRYFEEHYTYEVTARPLLEWAEAPYAAPDSLHAPQTAAIPVP